MTTTNYQRILSAIDGSESSDKAFKKALEIAKENQATLILAHVIDATILPASAQYIEDADIALKNSQKLMEAHKEKAKSAGVADVEIVIEKGYPRTAIAEKIAPHNKVDLIVIGAQGLGVIAHMLLGSVSEATARYAKCDVLVVK